MASPSLHRRPSSTHAPPQPPHAPPIKPNLTTTLYHTHIGIFALTWSRTLFNRSLHLHLLPTTIKNEDEEDEENDVVSPSFHLHIKPLLFWTKLGSKKIRIPNSHQSIHIHYDLSKAKFGSGSGPEPVSGFYVAVAVAGELALVIGDSYKPKSVNPKPQMTILRREHVYGISNKKYATRATFRGKAREISIDCTRVAGEESRLSFSVDGKRVLIVKHLQWKFRGNERVEIDGVNIQISWDVRNWLTEEVIDDGYALFMFRFEKSGFDYHEDDKYLAQLNASGSGSRSGSGFGFGFEMKKMKKGMTLKRAKSSSSSSLSSASSSGGGSVMEWESVEENELKGPSGFSLLVYAWKG